MGSKRFATMFGVLLTLGACPAGTEGEDGAQEGGSTGTTGGGPTSTTDEPTSTSAPGTTEGESTSTTGAESEDSSTGPVPGSESDSSTGPTDEDVDPQAEDFVCVLEWEKVHKFRLTNLLGHVDEAIAVANSPSGGVYPVGTVISLLPTEVFVKRRVGFSPETKDWEFFLLEVSGAGATILQRGTTDVTTAMGQTCVSCHSAAEPQWDFICDEGHGCTPIGFTPQIVDQIQNSDPRCP